MADIQLQSRLQDILHQSVERGELAGANVLVRKDDEEICYIQDGYADRENQKKIERDSIFRLYSMTKPITGAAVMSLVEKGLLDLETPVSWYLSGFVGQTVEKDGAVVPVQREVSVMQLLSMTSGLVYDGSTLAGQGTAQLFDELVSRMDGENPMTTMDFCNRLGRVPLAFEPGTDWCYGTSADVLGAVVEAVSGKSFGEYLKETFFEPLGMKDTAFYVPEEKQSRLVKVYARDGQGSMSLYSYSRLGISNSMKKAPAFESGGAGLVSTIDDYSCFAKMLLQNGEWNGRQILKPYTVQYFASARLNPVQRQSLEEWGRMGYSYGNLMRVMREPARANLISTVGEYGWDGWLGPYFANFPEQNMTILLMMQMTNAGTTPLTRKLQNVIVSSLV